MKLIWTKYYALILRLYDKKIDATGLSVFRVLYGLVMLCEVIQMYIFRHLIFDKIPFIEPGEIEFGPALIMWMLALICFIIGFFTRWASVINYLFTLTFIATIHDYEYHMCYVYVGVNFLLMFVNTWQSFSLDRLIQKLKYCSASLDYIPAKTVSVLNYYILVFVAIGLFYFDSVFYKWTSPMWLKGLGMWLPTSYPQIVHFDASPLLNLKWLSIALGYITLIFETVFIFVFFRKNWRPGCMVVGVLLHIGILIVFPIPFFALGVIACYMLMVPVSWWRRLGSFFTFKTPKLMIYYDTKHSFHNNAGLILNHLDWFKAIGFRDLQTFVPTVQIPDSVSNHSIFAVSNTGKTLFGLEVYLSALKRIPCMSLLAVLCGLPGIIKVTNAAYECLVCTSSIENDTRTQYFNSDLVDKLGLANESKLRRTKAFITAVFVLCLMYFQAGVIYDSFLIQNIRAQSGLIDSKVDRVIASIFQSTAKGAKTYLGINRHAVFLEYHFEGYNHIIGVEAEDKKGKKYWLPFVDRGGFVDTYSYGMNWAKYGFRTNSAHIEEEVLKNGVRDFTAFWARKHGFDPKSLKYHIHVKKIDATKEWEYNFLKKQARKPWIHAGTAYWNGLDFVWEVKDIEKI